MLGEHDVAGSSPAPARRVPGSSVGRARTYQKNRLVIFLLSSVGRATDWSTYLNWESLGPKRLQDVSSNLAVGTINPWVAGSSPAGGANTLDNWYAQVLYEVQFLTAGALAGWSNKTVKCIIWLRSIVANALDCLSSYRGFESHRSRQEVMGV